MRRNNGKWKDKQIIPGSWVQACITPYSKLGPFGVGFKWVSILEGPFHDLGSYFTTGYGGHVLAVAPKAKLLLVHRAHTFAPPRYVPNHKIQRLMENLLLGNPNLIPAETRAKLKPFPKAIKLENYDIYNDYVGKYENVFNNKTYSFEVRREGTRLYLSSLEIPICSTGDIEILPLSPKEFFLKCDYDAFIKFSKNDKGEVSHFVAKIPETRPIKGIKK